MKCPRDGSELTAAIQRKVPVKLCSTCHGMWVERQDFETLEDEAFDLGEHAKGTLVFDAAPTDHPCPECGALLEGFQYRAYDLQLELCPNQHGYWLEAGEDARVLELMRKQEAGVERSVAAEDRWTALVRRLRSGSFLQKVRELIG